MNECKGNPRLQKALAMALYIHWRLGRCSCLQNYTINKLHTITKISPTTLKKYLPILKELGWVRFEGKNNQHLTISKLCSHNEKKNIKVDEFCHKTFKDTYYSLRAFIALTIQARKDFIKRTLQSVENPKGLKEYRSALKIAKRLVEKNILHSVSDKYREWGITLERFAQEMGNCVSTACKTIKYAVLHGWVWKYRNYNQIYARGVNKRQVYPYTFTTKNNMYEIYPNIFRLTPPMLSALVGA